MDHKQTNHARDWLDAGQNGESSLTPEEGMLAGQLQVLGRADYPDLEFTTHLANSLAGRASEAGKLGRSHLKHRRIVWNGIQRAWEWGIGLTGIALLVAILVFSMNLLPRNAGAPGIAQPSQAGPILTPMPDQPTATLTPRTYTVQAGDTWSSIAGTFGMSVQELMALNGISDSSKLFTGQKLVVSPSGNPSQTTEVAPTEQSPTLPPGSAYVVVDPQEEQPVFVRQGPGSVYLRTAQLEPGVRVALLGRNHQGDWLQVEAPDSQEGSGWVFYKAVTLESPLGEQTIQALPVTSPLRPPDPGKPALSQSACASPVISPSEQTVAPALFERPGLLIGGDTLQVGDFTFDLWLHCDSVFGTSGSYLDAQSEIAGLGIYAGWSYQGAAEEAGNTQSYSGIEPYAKLQGGSGDLTPGSAGGTNLGLQFPLGVIPDFSQIDSAPLRFVYVIHTPQGEALGAVLAFTLERRADGFYPAEISVTPWEGDFAQLNDSTTARTPPVPMKDPAELYPVWQEAADLLDQWQVSLLSGSGWIHLRNRRFEPEPSNQLFGGRTEIISDQWFLLDGQGFVTAMVHLDRGTDGVILQQSYTKDGRTVNLTFGTDHPADPSFRPDLASNYTDSLLQVLQMGIQVDRNETTVEGRRVIVYSWTETYVTPLNMRGMDGERLVTANTHRETFDPESGRPLVSELYETLVGGEERLVWETVHEAAERIQTLPPEVLDLLGQEFQGYVPPAPDGTPAPEGFDPSQRALTARTIPGDSFDRPTRFYGDIYAGEYFLGRVDFGARPGGNCHRSEDGSKLAYTYEILEDERLASGTLLWLDLRDVSQVHEVAPELHQLGQVAWSPVSDQISFSACTSLVDGRFQDCGVYLYDLHIDQVRLLTDAGSTVWDILWKPDGTQIAFVSTEDDSHTYFVLDAANGDILAQGLFDADAWQFPDDAPVNDWGVSFPRGHEGTRCFTNP